MQFLMLAWRELDQWSYFLSPKAVLVGRQEDTGDSQARSGPKERSCLKISSRGRMPKVVLFLTHPLLPPSTPPSPRESKATSEMKPMKSGMRWLG